MKFSTAIFSVLAMTVSSPSCYAFHGSLQQQQQLRHPRHRQSLCSSLLLTPQDLTDYMAKANEAKVLAMKQIEDKKNAEIQVKTNEWNFFCGWVCPGGLFAGRAVMICCR